VRWRAQSLQAELGYSRRDAQFLRITGIMTMDEAREMVDRFRKAA
jgi:hypothetical protein